MTLGGAILTTWGAIYASTVTWAIARRQSKAAEEPVVDLRRALLIRPCAGAEPELADTLRSSVADSDPALAVRFAVAETRDRAWPIAVSVARELEAKGYDAQVVLTHARGANQKAAQIATVLRGASPEIVIVCDCDVRLERGDLASVVSPIARERAAAAWAVPVPTGTPRTAGDRLVRGVLGATFHAFPLLAALDAGGIVGKLFAVDRVRLDAVGSFDALASSLGEDVELARRLRARGGRVVSAGVARTRPRGLTVPQALERFVRWLLVVRGQRPWLLATYPVFFFSAVPCAVAASIVGGVAGLVAGALFGMTRIVLACCATPPTLRESSALESLAEGFAGDALLTAAFVRAIASRRLRWGGASLRVARGAVLTELR